MRVLHQFVKTHIAFFDVVSTDSVLALAENRHQGQHVLESPKELRNHQ